MSGQTSLFARGVALVGGAALAWRRIGRGLASIRRNIKSLERLDVSMMPPGLLAVP